MKLKKTTIEELNKIIIRKYNLELPKKDLEKLAYSLTGYFDLLIKIDHRETFKTVQKSSREGY